MLVPRHALGRTGPVKVEPVVDEKIQKILDDSKHLKVQDPNAAKKEEIIEVKLSNYDDMSIFKKAEEAKADLNPG